MAVPDIGLQLYRMSYEHYPEKAKGKQHYCTNSYEQTKNVNLSNFCFRQKLKCKSHLQREASCVSTGKNYQLRKQNLVKNNQDNQFKV